LQPLTLGLVIVILLPTIFPFLLLALLLGMERVERPLQDETVAQQLERFLDDARPEEIETYVAEGLGPALDRYWRRRRVYRAAHR